MHVCLPPPPRPPPSRPHPHLQSDVMPDSPLQVSLARGESGESGVELDAGARPAVSPYSPYSPRDSGSSPAPGTPDPWEKPRSSFGMEDELWKETHSEFVLGTIATSTSF